MAPPPPIVIDSQAVSGITGSISLACWIIVFAPQIYENFRRKSSEGLSLLFIILWLLGDLFNVLGSILQGVLPTMIILAIYYTLADIVLLGQCLLYGNGEKTDLIHLSPANPMSEDVLETVLSSDGRGRVTDEDLEEERREEADLEGGNSELGDYDFTKSSSTTSSAIKNALFKSFLVVLVILAGLVGWYVSNKNNSKKGGDHKPDKLVYDPLAQLFGWLCAFLYLGSRIPQIVLNFERKSCEGISFMFFLFACLGNLTYVISILAIDTSLQYLWVNSSWLAGSLGTLGLDFTIFVQFFIYNEEGDEEDSSEELSLLRRVDEPQYGTLT
ncbi:uncharacterized protein PRCAT00005311001 [Priceomyces carsonii]|uniref:uncharacterized protein n=1 Tax=Priceomyces carsonii TaxID=28549 RepID=UPI002ED8F6A3|nr:unnamed protein product [Priceomyces carsonii]